MSTTPIKSSYSILVMRDDCTVSTFRMRAFWFKVIIVAVIILILSCAAAVYGTYYYYGRYQTAAEKRNSLQAELTLAKVELQERRNLAILPMDGDRDGAQGYSVASMVKAYRPPEQAGQQATAAGSSQTSTQASTPQTGSSSGSPSSSSGETAGAAQSAAQSGQNAQPSATAGNATPTATAAADGNAAQATPSATPSQSDLSTIMGQDGPVTVAGLDQPVSAPLTMEKHPIKVSNLASAFEAGSKMRLSFDIANQPQKGALAGDCRIFAITRQGAEVELPPVSRGSLTFRIERYRRMQTTMNIPGDLKTEDILSLKVEVKLKDNPDLYWNIFPVK